MTLTRRDVLDHGNPDPRWVLQSIHELRDWYARKVVALDEEIAELTDPGPIFGYPLASWNPLALKTPFGWQGDSDPATGIGRSCLI